MSSGIRGVANRFAHFSNKLVEQKKEKNHNISNKHTFFQTSYNQENGSSNPFNADLQQNKEITAEGVIKSCKEFSSVGGAVIHYLSFIVKFGPRLLTNLLQVGVRSSGGSSSSFLRDRNIKSNIKRCAEYLAGNAGNNFNYDFVVTNGSSFI